MDSEFQTLTVALDPVFMNNLILHLWTEEGYRGLLYDDKTGLPLKTGDTIEGNPTIASGWNVSSKVISPDRAKIILSWFAKDAVVDLIKILPWSISLPVPVRVVLADMCYNLGPASLSEFTTFLSLIKSGDYKSAADDLSTTLWHKQVGSRAVVLETLLRNS